MNFTIIEGNVVINSCVTVKSDDGKTDLYFVDGEISRAAFYPSNNENGLSLDFTPKVKSIINALSAYIDYKNSPKSPQ